MLSPLQASDESERTPVRTTGSVLLLLREPLDLIPSKCDFILTTKKVSIKRRNAFICNFFARNLHCNDHAAQFDERSISMINKEAPGPISTSLE